MTVAGREGSPPPRTAASSTRRPPPRADVSSTRRLPPRAAVFRSPDPCRPGVQDSIRLCTAADIKADIGLSMGIQGTEVAKESSDIIILDDNFATFVRVVRWGCSVYANIQKFIQFQLTMNIAAWIINAVSPVSSGEVPPNAVQLLWVNLIMDTEPPNDQLMQRALVGRREPLITNIMWRNLLIMALYQVPILLTFNFKGLIVLWLEHDNPAHAEVLKNTFIFNTFVLCQVFSEFNTRKPDELNIFKRIAGNRLFIAIIAITVVLQGPGIRTGFLKDGYPIKLNQGQEVTIATDYSIKDFGTIVPRSYQKLAIDVKPGTSILCADGTITLTALSCDPEQGLVRCRLASPLMEIQGCSFNRLQQESEGTKAQSKVTEQTCANLISREGVVSNMPLNGQQDKNIQKVTCQRSKQKTLRGSKGIKSIGILLITMILLFLPLGEARPAGQISEPVICNNNQLPKQINSVCLTDQPTPLCCEFIIYAVDEGGCICETIKHALVLNTILVHYRPCGGIKPDIIGTIKNCSTIDGQTLSTPAPQVAMSGMQKKKHFPFYWLLAIVLGIFLVLMICLVLKQKIKKDSSRIIHAPQETELTRRRGKSPRKRQTADRIISEQQIEIPVRDDVPFVMTRGRAASLK